MPPNAGINPIPDCSLTWVFGLLETLEDRGGRDDGYKIARDLQFKFGDLLKVMKAAEILGLVSTPAGDVVLEPLGQSVSRKRHESAQADHSRAAEKARTIWLFRPLAARSGRSLRNQGSRA